MSNLEQNELYRRIDEVLFYLWDPVSVSDAPEARNEYEGYVPKVHAAVVRGDTKEQITDLLLSIAKEDLEVDLKRELCEEVAELVLDWSEYLKNKP